MATTTIFSAAGRTPKESQYRPVTADFDYDLYGGGTSCCLTGRPPLLPRFALEQH